MEEILDPQLERRQEDFSGPRSGRLEPGFAGHPSTFDRQNSMRPMIATGISGFEVSHLCARPLALRHNGFRQLLT